MIAVYKKYFVTLRQCIVHFLEKTRLQQKPPLQNNRYRDIQINNFLYLNKKLLAQAFLVSTHNMVGPPHDNTNKMACAPSEDSDQPGHPPSLIRVFAVHMKKARVLSYPMSAQRRLRSDLADAQTDLSLRWAHMPFCWFCHEGVIYLHGEWRGTSNGYTQHMSS